MPTSPRPIVALVGRTNVGKSLLWNRLTESGQALVSSEAHTTRDRNYGPVLWKGLVFDVVDTGGMDTPDDEIGLGIRDQAKRAIQEANIVLFVVDAQAGILPQDRELARCIKPWNKHIWLVANKTDKAGQMSLANQPEFYRLDFGEPRSLSAATSLGVGDILDEILLELERLGHPAIPFHQTQPLRIALIGRPNVGKSSLVNAILGEERVIVSAVPHTTREPQDTTLTYKERELVLVDTAGMRHRAKIKTKLEEAGIAQNERALAASDVGCLVFDATQDPTSQDRHLAGVLEETSKGLILVANKWDLVENKHTTTTNRFEEGIRQLFPFLNWAPLVFVSALERQRTKTILDLALKVQDERHRHIDYNAVNRVLKACIKSKKPLASYGPKSPRIYDVAQIGHAPPTFLVTVHGEKDNVHPSWLKFFEKRLREKFGFIGTPIVVKIRHLPMGKIGHKKNQHGPGMEAVAGKIHEKPRLVNQTRRRQKHGGRRY
ncbi:MAG: ribosome biogenesis GTPase Der [Candidatus Uhrbacteria bacterium]|nr:ribosome biogenesis GTPase Der [Candidatus Uhrbacteria bacterium]